MVFTYLQDGSMSKEEFAYCWNNWIKKVECNFFPYNALGQGFLIYGFLHF